MSEGNVSPDIRAQFKALNIPPRSFQAGGVYLTKDPNVLMPGRNHIEDKPRLVIVMGNQQILENPLEPVISVIPITTVNSDSGQDLQVNAGTANLNKNSYLKTGMIQPILKTDLDKCIGVMDDPTFEQLKSTVLMTLGFFD
jgi:mRNA-degrading endonuclease toxin of MazEF toxin-antitoxin module